MAKGSNQKLKLVYLIQIMQEKTDDHHGLTMPQIIEALQQYDVTAERKSIYDDFTDLERLGIEVIKERSGRETYYHLGTRTFELAEVKLLVDAIQSSKFITRKKSRELIGKLKTLVSEYQGGMLQRQVLIDDRVKSMNESVFYNVDEVHAAINEDRKIRFTYFKWDIRKALVPRNGGKEFVVSPWALIWMDENYYMMAYDEWDGKMKNYRIDKMKNITITDEKRAGQKEFEEYDMARLSKSTFGMYGGPKKRVKIQFDNSMCGVFLDRFGKEDISFRPLDDTHSQFSVEVNVSPQFFAWIFGLGSKVRLVGPEDVVTELREYTRSFLANFQ